MASFVSGTACWQGGEKLHITDIHGLSTICTCSIVCIIHLCIARQGFIILNHE